MKKRLISLILTFVMLLIFVPVSVTAGGQSTEPEYAWVLAEINDYENADKWATSDAHESYIVTHGYSRGAYSASTTYEGDDPYGQGLGGTLAVQAVFSGVPDIIYPNDPVSLKFTFAPTENSVVKLAFSAYAGASFDQWDVPPGGATGSAITFKNADGEDGFKITAQNSESYDETITATLGSGNENSRIALKLGFYMGVSMGTNYVYEWKQVGEAPEQPTESTTQILSPSPMPTSSPSSSPSPTPKMNIIRFEVPPPDDPEWETYSTGLVKFGDLHGEVNVKRYGEDDDAYIFAELDTPLHHGIVIKTLTRSGAILSFSDMSTFVVEENTIIVLDIKNEKESKLGLIAGRVWTNLKKLIEDGSMEVEMSQAIAGARGTTFICEEHDGVSVVKVIEGTVEYTSKTSDESVLVKGGQMISADSNGLGELTAFDIDTELKTWDESTQELTAEALEKSKSGLSTGIVILIILAALVLVTAIVVILLKRRKPAPILSPAYPQAPVYQSPPVSNDKSYNPAAKFCPNCGSPITADSQFCQHCGKDLTQG